MKKYTISIHGYGCEVTIGGSTDGKSFDVYATFRDE